MKQWILNRFVCAAVAALLGWSSASAADKDEAKKEVRVVVAEAPADVRHVKRVVVEHGSDDAEPAEPYAFLGVETARASSTLREQLGLPRGIGLVVQRVVKETAAAEVLKQHDIPMKLDDQLLVSSDQLGVLVRSKNPGDEVTLTLVRGGQEQAVTVKLGERKGEPHAFRFNAPGFEFHSLPHGTGELPERLEGLRGNISDEEVGRMFDALRVEHGEKARAFSWHTRGDGPVVRMLNVAAGNVVFSDERGVVELQSDEAGQHLLVKDAKGAVLFDGPVTTEEQRAALSETVKARLEKVESIRHIETAPADHLERSELRVLGVGDESAAVGFAPSAVAIAAGGGEAQ